MVWQASSDGVTAPASGMKKAATRAAREAATTARRQRLRCRFNGISFGRSSGGGYATRYSISQELATKISVPAVPVRAQFTA